VERRSLASRKKGEGRCRRKTLLEGDKGKEEPERVSTLTLKEGRGEISIPEGFFLL